METNENNAFEAQGASEIPVANQGVTSKPGRRRKPIAEVVDGRKRRGEHEPRRNFRAGKLRRNVLTACTPDEGTTADSTENRLSESRRAHLKQMKLNRKQGVEKAVEKRRLTFLARRAAEEAGVVLPTPGPGRPRSPERAARLAAIATAVAERKAARRAKKAAKAEAKLAAKAAKAEAKRAKKAAIAEEKLLKKAAREKDRLARKIVREERKRAEKAAKVEAKRAKKAAKLAAILVARAERTARLAAARAEREKKLEAARVARAAKREARCAEKAAAKAAKAEKKRAKKAAAEAAKAEKKRARKAAAEEKKRMKAAIKDSAKRAKKSAKMEEAASKVKKTRSASKKLTAISFSYDGEPGMRVFVAGSFNDWNGEVTELVDVWGKGAYSCVLNLPRGEYQYKLVVDGLWCNDPKNPAVTENGLGSYNNVIVVK